MKDYILWLTSGESIYGTVEDAEYERIETLYLSNQGGRQKILDTDGILLVDFNNVLAVGINEPIKNNTKKEVGFKIDRDF